MKGKCSSNVMTFFKIQSLPTNHQTTSDCTKDKTEELEQSNAGLCLTGLSPTIINWNSTGAQQLVSLGSQ